MNCARPLSPLSLLALASIAFSFAANSYVALPQAIDPPAPALSEAIQIAISQVDDDDYIIRNKAIEKIKAIFSQQLVFTASVKDVDAQANILPVMIYNEGLCRWLEVVLSLPAEQQHAQLELAQLPKMLKILSGLFSAQARIRIASIHELAQVQNYNIDSLLGRLISDADRQVSLTAMEVAWESKPTPWLVRALWEKATQHANWAQEASKSYTFRGEPLNDSESYTLTPLTFDSDIATDVLIHLNATMIGEQLLSFLSQSVTKIKERTSSPHQDAIFLGGRDPIMRNMLRLVQALRLKAALPDLYIMATHAQNRKFVDIVGRAKYFSSNRTSAVAVFLALTDQPHAAFFQKDFPLLQLKNMWVVSDEWGEDKAVEDIEVWWKQHGKEYGST